MRAISVLFAISVAFLVIKTVQVAGRIDRPPAPPAAVAVDQQLDSSVAALNAEFQRQWKLSGVKIAERADDLSILRRLSLSLFGTVPSLEDIRRFEADQQPHRARAHVDNAQHGVLCASKNELSREGQGSLSFE